MPSALPVVFAVKSFVCNVFVLSFCDVYDALVDFFFLFKLKSTVKSVF